MSIIGNVAGAAIGIHLINGKIKPKKKGILTYIVLGIFALCFIGCIIALIYGLSNMDIECIFFSLIGMWAFGYVWLISPYTQNSNNYSIKVQNENSFEGFELFYKERKVELKYLVDEKGKFKFADNDAKLECVSYADGTKMSNYTKYRVLNYFSAWLISNDYLSEDVTVTFEKI